MKHKIIIIGDSGAGHSKAISTILSERNLTLDDVIIIDSSEAKQLSDIREDDILEKITLIPITNNSLPMENDVLIKEDKVPFSKFRGSNYKQKNIGNRNYNIRRR